MTKKLIFSWYLFFAGVMLLCTAIIVNKAGWLLLTGPILIIISIAMLLTAKNEK